MKYATIFSLIILFNSCLNDMKEENEQTNDNSEETHEYTNALIDESSPYLLQHAHNPVDWMPWGEEALQKAQEEDKPIIISIGYSACHWCHVMEHESFEDTSIARLMNQNFICIKIDREERPDIDQVYMNAVQLMTGSGGWPLNCFATPDGRPFYGGTYFRKEDWRNTLFRIDKLYKNNIDEVERYANQLTEGVKTSELIIKRESVSAFDMQSLEKGLSQWASSFDQTYGGNNRAPKFPIPNNYEFLLNYYYHTENLNIRKHLLLTLEKMAYGGIYDQIGGGFARYSTDMEWKVPHFEKMLYDNAQLISLYSKAYRLDNNKLYQDVVDESIAFIQEELMAKNGAFYSALDADSEGEEGKFYVWKKEEMQDLLGGDFGIAEDYFNINDYGFWEHENYVLIRNEHNTALAKKAGLNLKTYESKIKDIKSKMKEERAKRIKPALDDKTLTSWNALTIKGLLDAYLSFNQNKYLELALQNAEFLVANQFKKDGSLWHSYKDGKSSINGYLEDYCFTIEAFIALYEVTLDQKWLDQAHNLAEYTIAHFYDESSSMFFFTSDEDPALIARKTEVTDNVIPASNSSMAKGLHLLSLYFENEEYDSLSKQMLSNMLTEFDNYLPSYTNWGILLMQRSKPFFEVAICGKDAREMVRDMHTEFHPNKMFVGSTQEESDLPLLEYKWIEGQTTIYVCENKVCQLPVMNAEDALQQLIR